MIITTTQAVKKDLLKMYFEAYMGSGHNTQCPKKVAAEKKAAMYAHRRMTSGDTGAIFSMAVEGVFCRSAG